MTHWKTSFPRPEGWKDSFFIYYWKGQGNIQKYLPQGDVLGVGVGGDSLARLLNPSKAGKKTKLLNFPI